MNIEFHYYALHYLAREAGYSPPQASAIAISSQLVDECQAPWNIIAPDGKVLGQTQVTQNYAFWDGKVASEIYRPFHFVPGERSLASRRRADGLAGANAVTDDSPLSRALLVSALKSQDLYRVGIALHAYADTWAHQNFSGDSETQNSLEPGSPLPPAGHLQALGSPDRPRETWIDTRLVLDERRIVNAKRFSRAAIMILRFLRTSLHRDFLDDSLVAGPLEEIWAQGSSEPEAAASDYIVELGVPPYEPSAWLPRGSGKSKPAFSSTEGVIPIELYENSPFEQWNKAAAAHKSEYRRLTSRGNE